MKKQLGFTLIEIMIALLLGLIVVGAIVNIYVATVSSSSGIIRSTRLNHDLDAVMTLMINDIKRAGYWGRANVAADSRVNPFTMATTNIQIPAATCILYSYDADGDGTVDSNEYYGFKLEDNSIKMRKTGATTANCDDGTWEEFVDGTQLTITALTFSFAPIDVNMDGDVLDGVDLPAASRCLNVTTGISTDTAPTACTAAAAGANLAEKRLVNILLAGQLKSEGAVIKTLSGTIEVRNNRLLTQP